MKGKKKKTVLKVVEETVKIVDSNDVDDLVEEVYGHSFSFAEDQELGNSQYRQFVVGDPRFTCDHKRVETFAKTGDVGYGYLSCDLLKDLCEKGYIEPGTYFIKVSW